MSNDANKGFSLELNGKLLIEAGSESCAMVIFHNLTGRNFEGNAGYPIASHQEYMDFVADEYRVESWTGSLTVKTPGGEVIQTHHFSAEVALPH